MLGSKQPLIQNDIFAILFFLARMSADAIMLKYHYQLIYL